MLNRSLFGVAAEITDRGVGKLYGAPHGFEGILDGLCIDVSAVTEEGWRTIASAPGAVIGSTRQKLRPDDVSPVFDYLDRLDVGTWYIIGGNDSAETGHLLQLTASSLGYDLSVVNVPKTIDNDLVITDHSPGYGSAARFIAIATMGSGRDAEALRGASPITIIEVMGRDAGWLAASSSLASRDEAESPHMICVPEISLDEDAFLTRIEQVYSRFGFALAVVSENVRGPEGVIGGQESPSFTDDFGHEYYDGPARYLAGRVSRDLGVRARYEKPGTIQRSFASDVSQTDAAEAELVGRAAVAAANDGHEDVMVTLVRDDGDQYGCTTGLASLEAIGGRVKTMPGEFLDSSGFYVTSAFIEYAEPLVGPLPRFGRLNSTEVSRI